MGAVLARLGERRLHAEICCEWRGGLQAGELRAGRPGLRVL